MAGVCSKTGRAAPEEDAPGSFELLRRLSKSSLVATNTEEGDQEDGVCCCGSHEDHRGGHGPESRWPSNGASFQC